MDAEGDEMEVIAHEMQYLGEVTEECLIECVPFERRYFERYMELYNEAFYEMRKSLEIEPYNFLHGYEQIEEQVRDIFLLLEDGNIVGSVACYENEVDDLFVAREYQGRGYGRQLLLWGMHRIRRENNGPITLHVADWNRRAIEMYKRVGFEITNTEKVR